MIRAFVKPLINIWEKIYASLANIHVIENSPYKLLRISSHAFTGKTKIFSDGTQINTGDYIAELHISNTTLSKGKIGNKKIDIDLRLLPLFRDEITNLARLAQNGKLDPRIKGIWGVTLLGPALKRLGFQLKPMEKNLTSQLICKWMGFIKWVYSPPHPQPFIKNKNKHQGFEFWITTDQLIQKYGNKSSR